jgi:hypothetical protein
MTTADEYQSSSDLTLMTTDYDHWSTPVHSTLQENMMTSSLEHGMSDDTLYYETSTMIDMLDTTSRPFDGTELVYLMSTDSSTIESTLNDEQLHTDNETYATDSSLSDVETSTSPITSTELADTSLETTFIIDDSTVSEEVSSISYFSPDSSSMALISTTTVTTATSDVFTMSNLETSTNDTMQYDTSVHSDNDTNISSSIENEDAIATDMSKSLLLFMSISDTLNIDIDSTYSQIHFSTVIVESFALSSSGFPFSRSSQVS